MKIREGGWILERWTIFILKSGSKKTSISVLIMRIQNFWDREKLKTDLFSSERE